MERFSYPNPIEDQEKRSSRKIGTVYAVLGTANLHSIPQPQKPMGGLQPQILLLFFRGLINTENL